MKKVEDLSVKIFADGADKAGMLEMYAKPFVKGLTTNPTLMRKAGITDYKAFSLDILKAIPDRPISLEVFSDEFADMERQALEIASWGKNVYVKIPVMNTKRETSYKLIEKLAAKKVKLNVTALMTLTQVRDVVAALDPNVPSYVSVFAGRVADTGRDPLAMMAAAVELLEGRAGIRIDLGEPARAAEHFPRRLDRMSGHHRDQRHPEEARVGRQESR